MDYRFGSKDLERCLTCLGFTPRQSKASHKKYDCPKACKIPVGVRPFIIIVLNKKHYDDISTSKWVKQIRAFGFTDEQIASCLK